MSNTCYIVGASPQTECIDFSPDAEDCIIAADGGYAFLDRIGIVPDVVIGDFDSLGYIPTASKVIPYNKEKDDTDMMLAVRYGLETGYRRFIIFGGLGGRIDHSIANIQALSYICSQHAEGWLYDRNTSITVIGPGTIEFDETQTGIVSVFALDREVYGVTEKGLKFSLQESTLTNNYPLGISNIFIGNKSSISVREGSLLIILTKETDM